MDFTLQVDEAGRFIGTLADRGTVATVTASNVPAAGDDLEGALDDARTTGFGECFWEESGGEYRWMFRRSGDALTVVVLWSSGTLTGWQHVFRSEGDAGEFERRVHTAIDKVRHSHS